MSRYFERKREIPNAVTTPGGLLLGILGEINDMRVIYVKRDGKSEVFDVEYIKNQLDKPLEGNHD